MNKESILVVCLNPTFQKTMVFDRFDENEVNRCSLYRLDASGKGMNVARIISQIGGHAKHLTHLGGPRMDEMIDLIENDDIDLFYADSGSAIRTCTTIINKEHNTTTELVEEPSKVNDSTDTYIRVLFSQIIRECTTLVISGTRAPGYSDSLYSDFVKEAKELGKYVILDIKGKDLDSSLQYGPDIIKPNLSEFVSTYLPGYTVKESEDNENLKEVVKEKMKELYETYHTNCIITRGKFPVWIYTAEGFDEVETIGAEAVNTIGCGDSLTAGLAYHTQQNESILESLKKGIRYAAQNAQMLTPGSLHD